MLAKVVRSMVSLLNGDEWRGTGRDNERLPKFDWNRYGWVRSNALAQASDALPLLIVERGLFVLYIRTLAKLNDDWTEKGKWSEYACAATKVLKGQLAWGAISGTGNSRSTSASSASTTWTTSSGFAMGTSSSRSTARASAPSSTSSRRSRYRISPGSAGGTRFGRSCASTSVTAPSC